jgi:D-serine deaminase-like pyridoxal phosphate-dependent protein
VRSLTSVADNFRIAEDRLLLTPALVIDIGNVEHNVARMVRIIGADRWRPHIKTAKLEYTMRELVKSGVRKMKCATTLELQTACHAGAEDVLLAFPVVGTNATRAAELADQFPQVQISALIEHVAHILAWRGSRVSVFLDLNPGMDRTGAGLQDPQALFELARSAAQQGVRVRGLHYYDGHLSQPDLNARTETAHRGYDELMKLLAEFDSAGIAVGEVITSGTPALPCALSYEPFRSAKFQHTVSPGTVLYNDANSLAQLPETYDLRLAAFLVATVVSHPRGDVVTCDAGHKSMPVDSGVPNCMVLGNEKLEPLRPSEEHLPLRVPEGVPTPGIGERLYLVPRHVCPMINNFDEAVMVRDGKIVGRERVTARGHEMALTTMSTAAQPAESLNECEDGHRQSR